MSPSLSHRSFSTARRYIESVVTARNARSSVYVDPGTYDLYQVGDRYPTE